MFSMMAYIPLKMMDVGEVGGKVAGLATGAAAAGIAKSSYGEVTGSSSSDGDVSTGTDSVESDAEMETTSDLRRVVAGNPRTWRKRIKTKDTGETEARSRNSCNVPA